jgi:tetratricopeptide (TPR) repeat protein
MEELYGVFLQQLEKTAGVAEARVWAALIALSRFGWREGDLRQLLTLAASVLFPDRPPVVWDPLRFATWRRFLRAHLVARGEHRQLDFAHISLRQAIAERLTSEWAPQRGGDPRPALHSAMADYLETMPSGAPVRSDEIMWQMLGSRNLTRFAHYYALPDSGNGRLAEYLIEESHVPDHPLLRLVRAATAHEDVPEEERAAIGNKFNFDLHQALHEHDGWHLQAPLLQAAEALFSRLRQRNPQSADFARDLSVSYNKLGDLHLGLGHGEQALEFYQKSLDLREELRQRNPQSADFARGLSVSYNKLGDLHLGLGHGEQALDFYQKDLAIAEELRQRNPQSADFARDLFVSYWRMAALAETTSIDEAMKWWRRAYDQLSDMKQRGILLPTDEKYLEAVCLKLR